MDGIFAVTYFKIMITYPVMPVCHARHARTEISSAQPSPDRLTHLRAILKNIPRLDKWDFKINSWRRCMVSCHDLFNHRNRIEPRAPYVLNNFSDLWGWVWWPACGTWPVRRSSRGWGPSRGVLGRWLGGSRWCPGRIWAVELSVPGT